MRNSTRRWFGATLVAGVVALLTACNGGAGNGGSALAPNNLVPPAAGGARPLAMPAAKLTPLAPIDTYPGAVIGTPDKFVPNEGDMPDGGQGGKIDRIPCDKKEYLDDYHVHMYVGLIVNGRHFALPAAIGMHDPGREINGYIKHTGCFYWIHTHDSSGIVHIEDPRNLPQSSVVYHLRDVFDIWGIPHTAASFGPYSGPMHVFVGQVPALGQTVVKKYVPYTKPVGDLPMRSHEVVWIEIGNAYYTAKQLPSVTFYMEY